MQTDQSVLKTLAISMNERYLQDVSQGTSQQDLAASRRSDKEDAVRFPRHRMSLVESGIMALHSSDEGFQTLPWADERFKLFLDEFQRRNRRAA